MILLMVDLRVVDILSVDSHRVVSNWDLSRVVIPDMILELGVVTYALGSMRMCMEFRDEILFKEGRM